MHKFNDAFIIYPGKWKTNPQICDIRGISLLSIAGKVLAKIKYVCLNVHLDQAGLLPESRCGSKNLYCSINFQVAAILVM